MTRNDYRVIAEALQEAYDEVNENNEGRVWPVRLVESKLARAFAKNNKGFDPIAFKEMCGF